MTEIGAYILGMFLYTLAGGFLVGEAIDEFKKKHYHRFGITLMFALSDVVLMIKLIFA